MTEYDNPMFTSPAAQDLWASYLARVDALCGVLDRRQRADTDGTQGAFAGKLYPLE